jgi:hypothetical protein
VLESARRVRALLLADQGHGLTAETGETRDDRVVLAEGPVAGERDEIGEEVLDIVKAVRPVRVPGDLSLLPRGQRLVDVAERLPRPLLQARDLLGHVNGLAGLVHLLEFEDLSVEIGNGLFEIEIMIHQP